MSTIEEIANKHGGLPVSTTGHTPGPWTVEYDQDDNSPRAIKAADGEHVTFIDGSRYVDEVLDPEAHANARLIAAAPEMLAALEAVQRLDYFREHNGLAEIVRAAIAKAKGGA